MAMSMFKKVPRVNKLSLNRLLTWYILFSMSIRCLILENVLFQYIQSIHLLFQVFFALGIIGICLVGKIRVFLCIGLSFIY